MAADREFLSHTADLWHRGEIARGTKGAQAQPTHHRRPATPSVLAWKLPPHDDESMGRKLYKSSEGDLTYHRLELPTILDLEDLRGSTDVASG